MAAPGKTGSDYKNSDQERDNRSHDDTYGVNVILPVAEYDGAIYRLQADVDGNLKVTSAGSSSGTAAYSDSGGTDRKGLVDADRHVQTDVLSSALPTGAATAANQQTDALTDTQLRATPIPVSGTVTATPTGTQNVDVTANTIGLATSAKQLPDGHNVTVDNGAGASAVNIQDGGNTITVDGTVAATQSGTWTEANSAAIKTAVETIDNAISGNEMQVDVVAPLPPGTNAIGKLSANSGVDIGDVDVTSTVLPAGAATSSVTSVADTTTSTTLKASNSSRKQIIIQNTSSAILYVKYGATATSSDFTVLLNQNDILIEDRYTGIIDGIWATDPGNGAAKVTEIT